MKKTSLILLFILAGKFAFSQAAIEMKSSGSSAGNGPTKADQTVSFRNDSNNPSPNGTTSTSALTVKYQLTNQVLNRLNAANTGGLMFGAATNGGNNTPVLSTAIFTNQGAISSPTNAMFQSITGTTGGIDVVNSTITSQNYGIQIMASYWEMGGSAYAPILKTSPAIGKYYFGNLTLKFNANITNPVLQISGLGGFVGGTAGGTYPNPTRYSTELKLITPDLSLSKLRGNSNLTIANNNISNSASIYNTDSNSGAASGSVQITGTCSTVTFEVYLDIQANGTPPDNNNDATGNAGAYAGDQFILGVSVPNQTITVLPIQITSFTATSQNCATNLNWTSGTEINFSHFKVEASNDGILFESLANIMAKGSNSNYFFTDNTTRNGNWFYRLKMIDMDGSFVYSSVQKLVLNCDAIKIFPTISSSTFSITGTAGGDEAIIYNSIGSLVARKRLSNSIHSIYLGNQSSGMYHVLVIRNGQRVASAKVIKQ